jgi:P4 family phage/plasmid primase-like protien
MIGFIKRVFGYMMVGVIHEEVLFFAYGTGQNGKGVTTHTFQKILHDYATSVHIKTLTVNPNDRHLTELACLRNARAVFTNETSTRRLDVDLLKLLTGRDPIKANYMRCDPFEFYPRFKPWMSGNEPPRLGGRVDKATRRRLLIIPYTVEISDAEVDESLEDELEKEWPAILRWGINGCLDWQELGLDPPEKVVTATDDFFEQADRAKRWFDERCEDIRKQPGGAEYKCKTKLLHASHKQWAEEVGESPLNEKRLVNWLTVGDRKFKRYHDNDERGLFGITLQVNTGAHNKSNK